MTSGRTGSTSQGDRFSRSDVLEFLLEAFQNLCDHDYAFKYTENEEDERASVYHYVRTRLDRDNLWRVFLSYSTTSTRKGPRQRPDMVFTQSTPDHKKVSAEIFVEMKNWPSIRQIDADVEKLLFYRQTFADVNPTLVFMGVLGKGADPDAISKKVLQSHGYPKDVHIWIQPHDQIFRGQWDHDRDTDPWRMKLRWE